MLSSSDTLVLVVDIQEKLLPTMFNAAPLLKSAIGFLKISRLLELPLVFTEQYPKGLGPTCSELLEAVGDYNPPILEKMSFSAAAAENIRSELQPFHRFIILGIECHVCVCQTCLELLEMGKEVHLVSECTGSRREANYRLSLERMKLAGAVITSMEMAAFELMKTATHPRFKDILKIIK